MTNHNADLDDFIWPERDQPDDETRAVIALLAYIGGGLTDGPKALAEAAAKDAGVPVLLALAMLQRHTGSGSSSDHFWDVQRVIGSNRQHYTLMPPS